MALETRLVLKPTQRLVMTAMLQQAIKLLPLSRLELIQKVQQEMLENPFLEELTTSEDGEADTLQDEEPPANEDKLLEGLDIDWEAFLQDSGAPETHYPVDNGQEFPSFEATLKSETSLADHLLWQLSISVSSERDKEIGAYLIGNIDDEGYLQCQLEEVAEAVGCSESEVEKVLHLIQSFDPAGIGARNLQECLLLQLRQIGVPDDSVASSLVREHLQEIDERQFRRIAKELDVPVEEVVTAMRLIRELDPQPGSRYNASRVEYIVPDVIVVKMGDDYQVMLSDEGMPRLRINTLYRNILRHDDGVQNDTKSYLEDKLRSAVWLIKSIEQRRQTLLKVAKSICKFQREFLDKGLPYLKPLILKDVADDIGMHESTVSRVTTNKYMHTPQGVFELKFFFHSRLDSAAGDAMSSVSVKDILKRAVRAEDARSPLTDQELVKLLEDKGIKIARRTVAKYRQELGVPPASRRKRLFDP
jgi:RNA polymerase sigma-54 factor